VRKQTKGVIDSHESCTRITSSHKAVIDAMEGVMLLPPDADVFLQIKIIAVETWGTVVFVVYVSVEATRAIRNLLHPEKVRRRKTRANQRGGTK
jgi:hypothetical protein